MKSIGFYPFPHHRQLGYTEISSQLCESTILLHSFERFWMQIRQHIIENACFVTPEKMQVVRIWYILASFQSNLTSSVRSHAAESTRDHGHELYGPAMVIHFFLFEKGKAVSIGVSKKRVTTKLRGTSFRRSCFCFLYSKYCYIVETLCKISVIYSTTYILYMGYMSYTWLQYSASKDSKQVVHITVQVSESRSRYPVFFYQPSVLSHTRNR